MKKKLNRINFGEIIVVDGNIDTYSFTDNINNADGHIIKGFCTSCEEKGINTSKNDSSFRLWLMSHGAHSTDFLDSQNQQIWIGYNKLDNKIKVM